MDIKKYIKDKRKLIDSNLDKYLPSVSSKPSVIHKAMRYAVFSGGKRIRPMLTLSSFKACGGKSNSIMPIACSIELIHCYTLIHDDLPCMDNDDYRRGKLSCHKKFGEDIALLAGDALLTLSFELLSKADNIDLIKEVSKKIGSFGTIGGQVVDMMKSRKGKKDLDYITQHKTGDLFELSVKISGIFKGVSKKKINTLANFGKNIGFTFQLVDDLLDKDGYFKFYNTSHIRKKAERLTEKAKKELKVFGKNAKRLSEIADLILERQN